MTAIPHEAKFLVVERAAGMPGSCKYPYKRVAVVLTTLPAHDVTIDIRRRGVYEIAYCSEPVPANGKTNRSGLQIAREEARALADRLNARRERNARRRESRAAKRAATQVTYWEGL